MGFMEKLTFWKKEEAPIGNDAIKFDEPESMNPEERMHNPFTDEHHDIPAESDPNFDQNRPYSVQAIKSTAPQQPGYDSNLMSKNIEIVSAKLDALKSELEVMNQRLMNIEAMAKREQQPAQNMPNYRRYQQW